MNAQDWAVIIAATATALVSVIGAIAALIAAARAARVDAKVSTGNGQTIGMQVDAFSTRQALTVPEAQRTAIQQAHVDAAATANPPTTGAIP